MSDSPPQKPRARVRKKALLSFTKLTAPKPVTKQLRLSADGKLEKSSTAQRLTTAAIERVTCDATGFLNALRTVNPTDCFVYGTPKSSSADRIVTVQQHEQDGQPENCIPRTNDAFQWPEGPGIMMLDYDPDQSTLSPDELRKALYAACPEMEQSAHVWAASASSCIFHAQTGHELGGIKGQRIYVLVTDAQDIPRAARVLHQRLWLNGHGYIKISKAGALLERSLIDQSVFQPSRIDFTAPAQCEPPLVQRKPPAHLHGDAKKTLATASALPDLTPDELAKYEQLVRQAKEQKKPEAEQLRATYIEARIHELEARGVGSAEAQQTMRDAFEHNVLHGDFLLHTENGQTVTVSELLKDKTRWHRTRFRDPLEPDYHHDKRIAMAFLCGTRPFLHSYAHGGQRFALTHALVTMRIVEGNRHEFMEQIVAHLTRRQEDVFLRGDSLVTLTDDGQTQRLNEHEILTIIDRSIRFEKCANSAWKPTNIPPWFAKHLLEGFSRRFPALQAVVTAPIIDPVSGALVNEHGYDKDKQLFAALPAITFPVPTHPTLPEVAQALKTVWEPVRLFPLAGPVDNAVLLSAILTSVMRPLLPTAPAFAFDAPAQGSGKTLLANVVAAIGGSKPVVSPHSHDFEETRKRLFASLVEGSPSIVIDNVVGAVDSPALAALLTSKVYSDRILGKSKTVSAPTNALVLFTGNNIRLKGDLPRRIPKCRIDPAMEAPHERAFPFDPLELATTNRQKIVAAALTLIRAAQNATQVGQSNGAGRLASFEVWDEFVRQTVCWLADLQTQAQLVIGHDASGMTIPALTDPMEAISAAVADDPVTVQLGRLLTTWVAELGTGLGAAVTVQHLAVPPTHSIPPVRNASSGGSSLYDILCEVASPHPVNHSVCTRRLGKYLASAKGRVVGGYSLREGPKRQGSISWWVEQVAATASSPIASAGGPLSVASTAATVPAASNPPLRLVAAGP